MSYFCHNIVSNPVFMKSMEISSGSKSEVGVCKESENKMWYKLETEIILTVFFPVSSQQKILLSHMWYFFYGCFPGERLDGQ